jgi:hypothetical protein
VLNSFERQAENGVRTKLPSRKNVVLLRFGGGVSRDRRIQQAHVTSRRRRFVSLVRLVQKKALS